MAMAPAKDPDTLDQGKGRVNRGADAPDQTNSSSDAELGLGSVTNVPSLSVPVRLAHIEDGCEDSLEEKRDGLYSTETWLCACIIENERLRRCRLLHHKRGA